MLLFVHLLISLLFINTQFVLFLVASFFSFTAIFRELWTHKKWMVLSCLVLMQAILAAGTSHFQSRSEAPLPFPNSEPIHSIFSRTEVLKSIPSVSSDAFQCSSFLDPYEDLLGEPYFSMTVLDLGFTPRCWSGRYFYNDYFSLTADQVHLKFVDGRLFAVMLKAIPEIGKADAYVTLEVLLSSTHPNEKDDAWLVQQNPSFSRWHLDLTTGASNPDFLEFLKPLGVQSDPIPLSLVPDTPETSLYDWVLLAWLLCFSFVLGKQVHEQKATLCLFIGVQFLLLSLLEPPYFSDLRMLSFEVIGSSDFLYLLSTPLHVFLVCFSCLLLAEIHQSLIQDERLKRLATLFLLLAFGGLSVLLLDGQISTISFNHPVKCLQSPDRFIVLLALFSALSGVFRCLEIMGKFLRKRPWQMALLVILLAILLTRINVYGSFILIGLVFVVRRFRNTHFFKSALIVLSCYPLMVINLHRDELNALKTELLDELTLLDERNYFLTIEMAKSIPRFVEACQQVSEEHLAYLFAKSSGLLDRDEDYLVSISSHDGRQVSELNNHVNYDSLSLLSLPNLKISSFTDPLNNLKFMAYRESFERDGKLYDLTIVLNNDYRNFSLAKQLRLFLNKDRSKPFAYQFEVFSDDGRLMYSPVSAFGEGIGVDDLVKLQDVPVLLKANGRDTVMLVKIKGAIYRLTHVATPLKMIFARFIILWTLLLIYLNFTNGFLGKRRSFFGAWRKSFSFKLSVFLFSSSVLLVLLFCYFWVVELRKNQEREQELFIESKVLAAQEMFTEIVRDSKASLYDASTFYDASMSIGADVSLFVDGVLKLTTQPELFFNGLLKPRIAFVNHQILQRADFKFLFSTTKNGSAPAMVYLPLKMENNEQVVIGLTIVPFGQKQAKRFKEQLEVSLALLLGILFVLAIASRSLSKNFLKPVSAITRSASRITKGQSVKPINITRHDELQKMVTAFNFMLEAIRDSQGSLEKQIEIQDLTLNAMSNGILGFNQDFDVVLQNDKAWSLLQIEPIDDFVALCSSMPEFEAIQEALNQQRDDSISINRMTHGDSINLLIKGRQVDSETAEDVSYVLIIEDITDLIAKNRFKAWSEMASRIAHEIKNPLTPIQLEMEFLQKYYNDGRPGFEKALDEACEEILSQVKHLKKIAAEFSDYSKPMTLNPVETNLSELCEDILLPYRKSLENLDIVTAFELTDLLLIDPKMLRRAIHNLVINAIQAMDEMGRLELKTWRDESAIYLKIADSGPGIAEEEKPHIFDAYFSTKEHGSGLGLVITKRIIQAHKGQILIDSTLDVGTSFIIKFPNDLISG